MCTKAEHKSDEEQASNISGLSNAVQGANAGHAKWTS